MAPTEEGVHAVERALGVENLYDSVSANLVHQLQAALRAKELYHRDKDYIIQRGEVKIVDEFTGRILDGRRWSEGLHQAVEAKEGVKIKEENQTLATITLQNYFRLYEKLAGMTGTAVSEANELFGTYGLHVVPIPTNLPVVRADEGDLIYKSEDGKFNALVEDLVERYERGQPVLVGTVSVENSEKLADVLNKQGIPHEVLNAKQHFREAEIVAQAGRLHAITVATNMAGRGVDIVLGGNPEAMARRDAVAEGLDPAASRARPGPLSCWKNTRLSAGPRVRRCGSLAASMCWAPSATTAAASTTSSEDVPVARATPARAGSTSRWERRPDEDFRHRGHELGDGQGPARGRAHRGQDGHQGHRAGPGNGGAEECRGRKNVLKYDEVLNEQRKVIYKRRAQILSGGDLRAEALEHLGEAVDAVITVAPAHRRIPPTGSWSSSKPRSGCCGHPNWEPSGWVRWPPPMSSTTFW